MRSALAYTSARIVLLVVSAVLLYLAGARGLLLLLLAFVVSGIVSFVLLSRQRDKMSGALMTRLKIRRPRGPGLRARLEEGARAEDQDLPGVNAAYSQPPLTRSFSTASTASWRVITEVSSTRSASRGSS